MKTILSSFTLIILLSISCNTSFLNHKDYELKITDMMWQTKIEGHVGEIYIKESNLLYGINWDSTFVVISPDSGFFIDTLKPFQIEKERVCLILDSLCIYKDGYQLYNVPVDKQKYTKVTLKVFEPQYRGDNSTFFLIINTLSDEEFIILFNREDFCFISDITYFKDGKFIITYNGESENVEHKYFNYVGLFDLEKLLNK